ncbi:MAG: PucR family transcriptional regulator [Eubacteriales bacterium]
MKLSLWMIANQLEDIDVKCQINESITTRYMSVHIKPVKNCLYLKQDESDSLLIGEGEDNLIRLINIDKDNAFELIQSIFDIYTNWDYMLHETIETFDYQKIIDESWLIFKSPILLLDSNKKLLAMSSQVGKNNLNPEWKHLSEYGYQSVNNHNLFRQTFKNQETKVNPKPMYITNPPTSDKANFLTNVINHNGILYGRITIMEYGRKMTEGDFQNILHISKIISKYLFKVDREDNKVSTYSNILKLIQGQTISEEAIDKFLSYMNWKSDDYYRICVVMMNDTNAMLLVQEYLRDYLPLCPSYIIDGYIVLLFNESRICYKDCVNGIKETYLYRLDTVFGSSLQFIGLNKLNIYLKQAIFAIKDGLKCKPCERFFVFYKHAQNYILESASIKEKLCACHPDVIKFWLEDPTPENQTLLTLKEYLHHERSLLHSSEKLFIHRNTLLYRINKIIENMAYDINKPYTREYILISIRILYLFNDKL